MEGRNHQVEQIFKTADRGSQDHVFLNGRWWSPGKVTKLELVAGNDFSPAKKLTGFRVELNATSPRSPKKVEVSGVRNVSQFRSRELTPIRLADRKVEKIRFASLYVSDKGVYAYIEGSNLAWEVRLDQKGYPEMSHDSKMKGLPIVTLTRTESNGDNRITTAYWRNKTEFDRVFNDNC